MSGETIVMIKPDGVHSCSHLKDVNGLYRSFAAYISSQIEKKRVEFDLYPASLAAKHIEERALTEKAFIGDYSSVQREIVDSINKLSEISINDVTLPNSYVIIMGILFLDFSISNVKEVILSRKDVEGIYKDKIRGHEKEAYDYFVDKKVILLKCTGNTAAFLLQHFKIFVRRFLSPRNENDLGMQNLLHVSDKDDIWYLNNLMEQ